MMISRTLAVKDSLIRDIEKALHITVVLVQLVFFGYYGYSIFSNLDNIVYLIIYSLLFVLSLISFIYYLTHYKKVNDKSSRVVKFMFRLSKYLVNGSMLVTNIILLSREGGDNTAYILTVVSAVTWIFQIIIEIMRGFFTKYIDLFTIAIDKDTRKIRKIIEPKSVKGTAFAVVDASLAQVTNRLSNDSVILSKNEQIVEDLYIKRSNHVKVFKKEKRKAYENRQKNEIKGRLGIIKEKLLKK